MNNFIDSVPGQKEALENLYRLFNSNRVPHAFIFSGKSGIGKHLAALEFANLINSNDNENKDALRSRISKLEEPYVKFIFPMPRGKGEKNDDPPYDKLTPAQIDDIRKELDEKIKNPYHKIEIEKANNIKISSILDIKKFVTFGYDEIKYRVVILSDAHLMRTEAQNALLKTLEEPPEGFVFILLTDKPENLFTTIHSRCWTIDFRPLSDDVIGEVLEKYYGFSDKKKIELAASFAEGSVLNALALLNVDIEKYLDDVITVLRFSLAGRFYTAQTTFNKILDSLGAEYFKQTLRLFLYWLRDAKGDRSKIERYYFEKYKDTFEKFNSRYSDAPLEEVFAKIDYYLNLSETQVNLNLIALNTIFELSTVVLRK
jgi:DNA polymerase III delta prime subunit